MICIFRFVVKSLDRANWRIMAQNEIKTYNSLKKKTFREDLDRDFEVDHNE